MTVEKKFEEWIKNSGFRVENTFNIPSKMIFNEKECFLAEIKTKGHKIRDCEIEKAKLLKKVFNIETRFYTYKDDKFLLEKKI